MSGIDFFEKKNELWKNGKRHDNVLYVVLDVNVATQRCQVNVICSHFYCQCQKISHFEMSMLVKDMTLTRMSKMLLMSKVDTDIYDSHYHLIVICQILFIVNVRHCR